jgi:hypothetical protein
MCGVEKGTAAAGGKMAWRRERRENVSI